MAVAGAKYHDPEADQGSFLMGMTVGMVAGAFGFFLFATDRGEKMRREFLAEWQQAAGQMNPDQTAALNQVVQGQPGTLRSALWTLITGAAEVMTPVKGEEVAVSKHAKPKRPISKTTDRKFRGI